MKKVNTKKLATASILCAVAVVGSLFSFPVFGSKCAPVQHMVNIICAVLLGPAYGVGAAFVASLIRNLLGLGSLMAFPGSMFGALLCGLVRNGDPRRPVRLSRGDILYGAVGRGHRVLRIHHPVFRINGRRRGDIRSFDIQS